jgi:phosphoribosylformylglycinamidine synthase
MSKQHFMVEVVVTPQAEVADPQGQAIEEAARRLPLLTEAGCTVSHLRAGKVFRFRIEAPDIATAEATARAFADKVLANPNVESFTLTVSRTR